jgi:hypothetical protein
MNKPPQVSCGSIYIDHELLPGVAVPFIERNTEIDHSGRAMRYVPTKLIETILTNQLKISPTEILKNSIPSSQIEQMFFIEKNFVHESSLVDQFKNLTRLSEVNNILSRFKEVVKMQTQRPLQDRNRATISDCDECKRCASVKRVKTDKHRKKSSRSAEDKALSINSDSTLKNVIIKFNMHFIGSKLAEPML